MPSEANKRIAKNTLFLYVRMFLTIIVNLYTVRVIWQVLGVDDYGIYNVVGGIVMMFSFLNGAMVASSQRFISYELGRRDEERLNKVFCISLTVHFLLAVTVLILAETIGLWFLNHKLNIPEQRMYAANSVYQCSIIAFLVTIVSVPYNACIVAHEHMKVYGYLGILEVILKLVIVFLLIFIGGDKLIVYSLLVLVVALIMRILYQIYCHRHFSECRFHRVSDRHLMSDMFSFAGWSFIGNLGFSVRDQGLNIILNLFFNVAVNAAKGIAGQIGAVINGFAANFQMALNPQITKRYASGDTEGMMNLVFQGCKYSVLLMTIIVVPLIISAESLLTLWLGEVAPYTVGFMKLTLCLVLVESIVSPITTALQATGHIRNFQIIISIIMVMNLPLAWLWLQLDPNPYLVMVVCIALSIIGIIARLMLLHGLVPYSYRRYFTEVILRIFPVVAISLILSWWIYTLFPQNLAFLILWAIISCCITALTTVVFALNHSEKAMILNYVIRKLRKA